MTDDDKKADPRRLTPARERAMIATRLEPAIHTQVAAAAAANRRSLSAEVEHRVTASFDGNWTAASVTSEEEDLKELKESMAAAFAAGLRFGNKDQPIDDLLKDHFAFDRGII